MRPRVCTWCSLPGEGRRSGSGRRGSSDNDARRRRAIPPNLCVFASGTAPRRRLHIGDATGGKRRRGARSEEHTSELQSLAYLVCRLLLEKKKKISYVSY